ncbi:MAG: hypothetical protein L0J87_06540 [Tetragenococcus koreensis]|nr:hypothetical protein [Tetragenococcus koreensis]
MANENFRFFVEAGTEDAANKLKELDKIMDRIDSRANKGTANFMNTTSKDVDKTVADMQRMLDLRKQLNKEFNKNVGQANNKGDTEALNKNLGTMKEMNREYQKAQKQAQKLYSMESGKGKANNASIKAQKAFQSQIRDAQKRIKSMKADLSDIKNQSSRMNRSVNNATSTGRMTYKESQRLKGDLNAGKRASGLRDRVNSRRETLQGQLRKDRSQLTNVRENASHSKPGSQQSRIWKNEESAILDRINNTQKEIEQIKNASDELKRLSSQAESARKKMDSSDVKVDAERGTAKGFMQARAPAIAMNAIGSVAAVGGGLYAKGKQASDQMREPSISLGQRTGNSDFRAMRQQMQEMGTERSMGYKGADMLQFQDDVVSNMGYTNNEDMTNTTRALAEGSRAVPVDNESLSDFMNSTMRNGSISGGDQAKEIQQAFLGAIKQSGMEGREQEQIDALNQIQESAFSGRQGSQAELNNLMAMQSMLADTGNRSVQGEKGAQMMSGLNEGFQNAINDPQMRLIFGAGQGEYQGMEGRYKLRERLEEGLANPENTNDLMDAAKTFGGDTEEGQKEAFIDFSDKMGADVTTDQATAVFDMMKKNGGSLTEKQLKKVLKDNEDSGEDQYSKNLEDYEDSPESARNQSEAVTEEQATGIADPIADTISEVNSKMGEMPPVLYAAIGAVTAFTGTMLTSMAQMKTAEWMNTKGQSTFNNQKNPGNNNNQKNPGNKNPGNKNPGNKNPGGNSTKTATTVGKNVGKQYVENGRPATKPTTPNTSPSTPGTSPGFFQTVKDKFNMGKQTEGIKGGVESAVNGGKEFLGNSNKMGNLMNKMPKGTNQFLKNIKGGGAFAGFFGMMDVVNAMNAEKGEKSNQLASGLTTTATAFGVGGLPGFLAAPVFGEAADMGVQGIKDIGNILTGPDEDSGMTWKQNLQKTMADHQQRIDDSSWFEDPIEKAAVGGWNMTLGNIPGLSTDEIKEKNYQKSQAEPNVGEELEEEDDNSPGFWSKAWGGVKDFFTPEEASADEIDPSTGTTNAPKGKKQQSKNENQAKSKEEKDTANKKDTSEKKRENNNSSEKDNLGLYSKLLDRASKILTQARSQNGIFGNKKGNTGSEDTDEGGSGDSVSGTGGKGEEAIRSVAKEVGDSLGVDPSLIFGQLMHESANGSHTAGKNNYGGVTYAGQKGASKGAKQPDGSAYYADFKDLDSFANAYKDILDRMDVSKAGDADEYAKILRSKGYYTAPESEYAASLKDRASKFAKGGKVSSPTNAVIGEVPGQQEYVINPHQATAPGLLQQAMSDTAKKFDITGLTGNQEFAGRRLNLAGASGSSGGGASNMNNTNNFTINVEVSGDTPQSQAEDLANQMSDKMQRLANDSMEFFGKEYKRR